MSTKRKTQPHEEAAFHRALSDEGRLRMLLALVHGPAHVGKLRDIASLSQTAASQHLQRLLLAGFVERARDPEWKQRQVYSLAPEWAPLVAEVADRVTA